MTNSHRSLRQWLLLVGALVLLALVLPACSSAPDDARNVSLRRSFTLQGGQQRDGDQVVWAYDIVLAAESRVDGNATLVGDSIEFAAEVTGDVIIVADQLAIGPDAHVGGDLTVCVTDMKRDDAAVVDGVFKEECSSSRRVGFVNLIESGWESWQNSWFFRFSSVIAGSLFFGALAALGSMLFPDALTCMSNSIRQAPLITGGVGVLTMLVIAGVTAVYVMSLLLVFPIVLLPFVLIAWVVIVLFSLLGWVALAEPFGKRALGRVGLAEPPRMVAAAVGGVILALLLRVWSLFWFTAWIGLLCSAVMVAIGLGAVLLTRVGTKPYPHARDELIGGAGEAVARLAE